MASWNYKNQVLAVGNKKIFGSGMYVEPNFPSMFSLRMLSGNINALNDPSAVLLSASLAKTLFGNEDAMNKVIKFEDEESYKVAGVYEDIPSNSTFYETGSLLSWKKFIIEGWPRFEHAATNWDFPGFQAFVQVADNIDMQQETEKIKNVVMAHKNAATDQKEQVQLFPMDKWRLYSEFKNGKATGGRIQFIWLFSIIGVLVLMLATFFVIKLRQPSNGQPTVAENMAPAAEPQTNTQVRQPELPTLPTENNSTVAQAPDTDKISTGDGHTAQKPQAPSRQKGGGSYEEALTPKKAPLPTGIQLNPQSNSNRSDVVSTVPISVKEMLSTLGLNVDYEKGWKVSSVNKNSVAERAGIAAGDEILSLGDKDLTAGTSFQGSASISTIRYSRNGTVKTANIH